MVILSAWAQRAATIIFASAWARSACSIIFLSAWAVGANSKICLQTWFWGWVLFFAFSAAVAVFVPATCFALRAVILVQIATSWAVWEVQHISWIIAAPTKPAKTVRQR